MNIDITFHIIIVCVILLLFLIYNYVDNPIFMAGIILFAALGMYVNINSSPILVTDTIETAINETTTITKEGIDFGFFQHIFILFYVFSLLVVVINFSLGRKS